MGLAGFGGRFILMNALHPDHSIASAVAAAVAMVILVVAPPLYALALARVRRG